MAKRRKTRRIKAREPEHTSRIKATEIHEELVRFSFRHLDFTDDAFKIENREAVYFITVLQRLKNLCGLKVIELMTNRSRTLRAHPIDWARTSKPAGFSSLNLQLRDLKPYQFNISSNEHGRVHGFFIDATFYIVWFDPDHNLYP